jgi:hypothetical protein
MPKNTARLGKNGMKITTISPLTYESKLALSQSSSFIPPPPLENQLTKEATKKVATHNTTPLPLSENRLLKRYQWRIHF